MKKKTRHSKLMTQLKAKLETANSKLGTQTFPFTFHTCHSGKVAKLPKPYQKYRLLVQEQKASIQQKLDAAKTRGITPEVIQQMHNALDKL